MRRKIGAAERDYIRSRWGQEAVEAIAAHLDVSDTTVSTAARQMGLPRLPGRRRAVVLDPEQCDYIRDNWGSLPIRTIGRKLGLSDEITRRTALEMGLPLLRPMVARPPMAARRGKPTPQPATEPRPLPVIESDWLKPPSLAQLMAGR